MKTGCKVWIFGEDQSNVYKFKVLFLDLTEVYFHFSGKLSYGRRGLAYVHYPPSPLLNITRGILQVLVLWPPIAMVLTNVLHLIGLLCLGLHAISLGTGRLAK